MGEVIFPSNEENHEESSMKSTEFNVQFSRLDFWRISWHVWISKLLGHCPSSKQRCMARHLCILKSHHTMIQNPSWGNAETADGWSQSKHATTRRSAFSTTDDGLLGEKVLFTEEKGHGSELPRSSHGVSAKRQRQIQSRTKYVILQSAGIDESEPTDVSRYSDDARLRCIQP